MGTPATTNCYRTVSIHEDLIPGLGAMTTAYTLFYDDFGSACGHAHAQIPILVAGKGEIDLAARSTGCISPDNLTLFTSFDVSVSGGSGVYAGSSGSGVLDYKNSESGNGNGFQPSHLDGDAERRGARVRPDCAGRSLAPRRRS